MATSKDLRIKNGLDVSGEITSLDLEITDSYPTVYPSLTLDFSNSKILDPRITFTRASTATYINSSGVISASAVNAPRFDYKIEPTGTLRSQAAYNLLNFSEDFTNAYWNKLNLTITANSVAAPDGNTTADLATINTTATVEHIIEVQAVQTGANTPSTNSWYVKMGTQRYVSIRTYSNPTTSKSAFVEFDLQTGTVLTSQATNATQTSSITALANGWFRISQSVTFTTGTDTARYARLIFSNGSATTSYAGAVTSTLYVWGAQLELGTVLSTYIPTNTGAASRFSYNCVCKGLLVEESKANLVTYSEDFTNAAWIYSLCAVTANQTTAPDGTQTADLITINSVATGSHYFNELITVTANTPTTSSWFVKMNTQRYVMIQAYSNPTTANTASVEFDLLKGLILTSTQSAGTTQQFSITEHPNDWFRITQTVTFPTSTDTQRYARLSFSNGALGTSYVGALIDSLYVWGAQLEYGLFASSYIPTTTSVSRSGDVATISGTDFSNFYNATEGTILTSFDTNNITIGTYSRVWQIGNTTDYTALSKNGANGTQVFNYISTGNVAQATLMSNAITANTVIDNAFAYKINDFAESTDNQTVQTDTVGTLPTVTTLNIGSQSGGGAQLNGHIARISYYPKRLTDAQLQLLTK